MDQIHAVSRIVYSYAELLDLGDIEGCARLFERAVVRIQGADVTLEGAAAVQRYLEGGVQLHDGVPGTKHVVTNLMVDVDEERGTATARSYYTAFQARPELPLQPILAGRWHDRFVREEGQWWLTERVIRPDLLGDVRFHIKGISG